MYNNDIDNSKIISYEPNNLATMNTVKNFFNYLIRREENHLSIIESYLEIEFNDSDNAGGIIAKETIVRLVKYDVMTLCSSSSQEKIIGKICKYLDHCHPNLLIHKLLTRTSDEYESGFVRDQRERDRQLKNDHQAAQRGHMYKMSKMKKIFGFIYDLEKVIYDIGHRF